eukprot:evm.model.scf_3184EXC.3 EVM.evm.TU.scf_3184EXC.3   scf_3184EXC:10159-12281(-)
MAGQFIVRNDLENIDEAEGNDEVDDTDERGSAGLCGAAGGSLHAIVTDGLDRTVTQKLLRAPSVKLERLRTNSDQLPSDCDISSARITLSERLLTYGLVEKQMKMDGNCQFRSLSDQLYRTPAYHDEVRELVVCHIKDHAIQFKDFVPDDFEGYCKKIAKKGTWGDHITLKAAADCYGVQLLLLTSYPHASVLQLDAETVRSNRRLYLSYWAEVHYNSVYPAGEMVPEARVSTLKSLGKKVKRRLGSLFS